MGAGREGSGIGPSTSPPARSITWVSLTAAWSTTRWSSDRRKIWIRAGPAGAGLGLVCAARRGTRLDRRGDVVEQLGDVERLGQHAHHAVAGRQAPGVGRDDHDRDLPPLLV